MYYVSKPVSILTGGSPKLFNSLPTFRYNATATGYGAEPSANTYNQQQQQQYYNYYYQQQQQQQYPTQQEGGYSYDQTPQNPPQTTGVQTVPPPTHETEATSHPDQSADATNIEEVDMEMENESEDALPPPQTDQQEQTQQNAGNADDAPAVIPQSSGSDAVGYSSTQTPPQSQPPVSTEGAATNWTPQPVQPTTSAQWYPAQGGVASWSEAPAQSNWTATDGTNYYAGWQNHWQQQQQQQQQQGSDQHQQQQQWNGSGWGQWSGQGGVGNNGGWGQWQSPQQPGMEAWAGQSYGGYQQQGYAYPQSESIHMHANT